MARFERFHQTSEIFERAELFPVDGGDLVAKKKLYALFAAAL